MFKPIEMSPYETLIDLIYLFAILTQLRDLRAAGPFLGHTQMLFASYDFSI